MSPECSNGECVVNAFKLNPKHSVADIAVKQKNCPNVGPVYKAFIHDLVKAPTRDDLSGNSAACKYFF